MTDLAIAKLMLKKENLDKYGDIVYNIKTDIDIYKILITINKYYEEYKEHKYISIDELEYYFYTQYPSQRSNASVQEIFNRLRTLEISDSLAADIVLKYLEKDVATEILQLLSPVINGDGNHVIAQLPEMIDRFRQRAKLVEEEQSPFVEDDIEALMDLIDKRGGLQWGLTHLNQNIRSLPGLTLGHVFARVETGKTTFVASQITSFVSQLNSNQSVLWVCNEENGRFVKLRTYQSLLNMTNEEIFDWISAHGKTSLMDRFYESGGSKIRIHYDPNTSIESIRNLLDRQDEPRVLVVDIADHVSFRGDSDLAGPAKLGDLYRRFRNLAAVYGVDILTVGQASAECDGRKVLHMDHMHNSKTDKPGALDYAIGIGRTYNEEESERRWLTICKNKIGCTVKETDVVRIDTQRGRMYDV